MKTVIDINSFEHIKVPEQWIACSVCGEYHSPASYRKKGEESQSRTNCESCYNMPYQEMKELGDFVAKRKKSELYRTSAKQLQIKIDYASNSISVEDMISALQQLPAGSRLVITQEGYYAQGKFGDIFYPESEGMVGDKLYFSIGHSSQNS